eukprot:jgi/Ulvmu1/9462/UM052_0030.1
MVKIDTSPVRFTSTWVGDGDKVATVVDATSKRGSRLRLPNVLVDRCGLTWNLLFTRETDVAFCDLQLWHEAACGIQLTPSQRCVALQVAYTLQDTGRSDLAAPLSSYLDSTTAWTQAESHDFLDLFLALPDALQDLVLKPCSVRNVVLHAPHPMHHLVLRAHLLDGCRLNLCSTLKTPGVPPAIRGDTATHPAPTTPQLPPLLAAVVPLLPALPSLTHLVLAANALTPAAAPVLAVALPSIIHLSHLDLSVNRLAAGVAELAPALSRSTSLRLLDLGSNDLPTSAYTALSRHLRHHPSLRHLALGGNKLCPTSADALAVLAPTLPLMQLLLPRVPCPPGPPAAALCGGLAAATALAVLRLPQCALDSGAVSALAAALPHLRRLRVLDLALNNLSPRSVSALAAGLQTLPALLHLDLGWSDLRDEAASTALARALRAAPFRTCLQSLLLSNGHLTADVAVQAGLFAAPQDTRQLATQPPDGGAIGGLCALTELSLSHNPLADGSAPPLRALVDTLACLTCLGSLSMDNCGVGNTFLSAFATEAVPRMPLLETMTIAKNRFGEAGAAAVRRARPRKLLYVHWDWQKPEYGSDTTATPPESEDEESPPPPRISDV